MYNNYRNNYQPAGMVYNTKPPQMPKMTQGLTDEQIKELRQKTEKFSLKPTEREVLASKCTHRYGNEFHVDHTENGRVKCDICQKDFELIKREEVKPIIDKFLSLMETIKMYYVDMPESYISELFPVLPLLEKMDILYDMAQSNFNQYHKPKDKYYTEGEYYGLDQLNAIGLGYPGMYGAPPYDPYGYGTPQYAQPAYPQAPYPTQQPYPQTPYPQQPGYAPAPYPTQQQIAPQQAGYNPYVPQPQNPQQGCYGAPPLNPLTGEPNKGNIPVVEKQEQINTSKTFRP